MNTLDKLQKTEPQNHRSSMKSCKSTERDLARTCRVRSAHHRNPKVSGFLFQMKRCVERIMKFERIRTPHSPFQNPLFTAMRLGVFSFFFLAFSLAQFQAPDPEMQKKLEPYFNLMETVGLLVELDSSDTPISAEQATQLLPILNELKTSPGYTADHATELLDTIELSILTTEQLTWMDGKLLERMQQGPPGGPSSGNGQLPSGPPSGDGQGSPPGGFFQKIMHGEPVNTFTDNPNAMSRLDELIKLLTQKIS